MLYVTTLTPKHFKRRKKLTSFLTVRINRSLNSWSDFRMVPNFDDNE